MALARCSAPSATPSTRMGTRFAKVLEWLPNEAVFLARAGVGWLPGLIGCARVGADFASPSGYAFRTGEPVISNHLEDEGRFQPNFWPPGGCHAAAPGNGDGPNAPLRPAFLMGPWRCCRHVLGRMAPCPPATSAETTTTRRSKS
jgi:hypothetical protein